MTLNDLVVKELIWNKEKILVITDDENGKWLYSKVDRIEFLMYDFEDYKIDWFESNIREYEGEQIPVILFHCSKCI